MARMTPDDWRRMRAATGCQSNAELLEDRMSRDPTLRAIALAKDEADRIALVQADVEWQRGRSRILADLAEARRRRMEAASDVLGVLALAVIAVAPWAGGFGRGWLS